MTERTIDALCEVAHHVASDGGGAKADEKRTQRRIELLIVLMLEIVNCRRVEVAQRVLSAPSVELKRDYTRRTTNEREERMERRLEEQVDQPSVKTAAGPSAAAPAHAYLHWYRS